MSEEVPAPAPIPLVAKAKLAGGGLLVGLLLGGVGMGKVWLDKSSAVASASEEARVAQEAVTASAATANAAVDEAAGQQALLKARVAASDAAIELLRQNYGTAGAKLKEARAHLAAAEASTSVDKTALAEAQKASMATNIEVAGDLGAQVDLLRGLGAKIDGMVK